MTVGLHCAACFLHLIGSPVTTMFMLVEKNYCRILFTIIKGPIYCVFKVIVVELAPSAGHNLAVETFFTATGH